MLSLFFFPPGDLWLKSATKIPMEMPWNQSHQFTEIPWNPHELSTFFFVWNPKIPRGSHGIPNFRSNLRDPNTNQAPATTTSTWKPVRPRVSLPGGPTLKRKSWDSWDMNYLLGIFLFYKFVWEIYFVIIYIFVWDIIGIWLDLIYIYIWCNGICHEIWWHLESENGVYQETRTFLIGDSRDSLRQKPSRESRVSPVISPVDGSLW